MKESFLHFVWQFQRFDHIDLIDSEGRIITVFSAGEHNTNAGPDFLNAKIKIGKMLWHGHVEIHVSSSAWKTHGHQNDAAYDNVILHVVWENDESILHKDGKAIPTIELKNRVSPEALKQSDEILNSPENIACSKLFHLAEPMQMMAMQEKAAIKRLWDKSSMVFDLLKRNQGSWEEVTYQLLAKNFGFKINADPFLKLSQILPFKILKKHCGNVLQIEALLFGIAGFLNEPPKDEYHAALMNEYVFLAKKYVLEGKELNKAEWKFLRLRPANFPTVRLSQFSTLLNGSPQLFDLYTSFDDPKELVKQIRLRPTKYWVEHFDFGKKTKKKLLGIGINSLENTLINTAAPVLAAFSKHTKDQQYMDKSIDLLQHIKPEKNRIIEQWKELNVEPRSAFESQALIELYNNYCLKKQCLLCNIGVSIMNRP